MTPLLLDGTADPPRNRSVVGIRSPLDPLQELGRDADQNGRRARLVSAGGTQRLLVLGACVEVELLVGCHVPRTLLGPFHGWTRGGRAVPQMLSTRRSAASTARNSSMARCPTGSPSRVGSTALVCSVSTRVSRPSISIVGRNVASRADVEVGATSQVDSTSKSSDWTTTAYRCLCCSCPRESRGARRR